MWTSRFLIAAAILTTLAISHWRFYSTGYESGVTHTEQAWQAEKLATTKAQMAEMEKARQAQQALQAQVDKIRQESANEKRRVAAQYERTIAGLRERPKTRAGATGVPEGAVAGVGCTGAGLSRPDGEFLAWYAGEAARAQTALRTCIAAYNSARREVNGE
jgi:uncharacterized protein YlxW (UPF0749 family)